ncbi:MAG: N-acetylglucosamine-6-phosphate deacetylase [Lentisphaeria bacterium]|nr:N-acetylglucosamine-6-phosphate deacetylase [Lentisphaeria bacterium]
MSLLIQHAHVISPEVDLPDAALEIAGAKIKQVIPTGKALPVCSETYDAQGMRVVPGFIDTHCHGGMGHDVTSEDPAAMPIIAEAKLREGVTSMCPTTLTLSEEMLAKSLRNIEAYRRSPSHAKILGTHLEGPFINPECIGAQNPAYVRKPDMKEVLRLCEISPVSLVTYAVEMAGSLELTEQLVAAGICPSCGHTNATYAQFQAGRQRGLKRLTHFCNQMTKLHHREVGMVGAGLYDDDVAIEMICDKIHLCPEMIRLAFKVKPIAKILLMTDAMEATGLADGNYHLGGLAVVVKDGAARLEFNGALAGSTLRFNVALKNIAEVTGKPLCELIRTTSLNQAESLGIKGLGRLEKGYAADITVLDDDFAVRAVFVDGVRKI